MKTLVSLSALALLLVFALPASAQQDWSAVASTGEVDPASAQHAYSGASILFDPATTGKILARYNVTN
jgi:hypothetical protein